jgi:hypothetical protein
MKNIKNKNLTSFADHLDKQYGKRETAKREEYEQGFEAFKLGVLIHEMREQQHMTEEQLAMKCASNLTFQELKTTQAT